MKSASKQGEAMKEGWRWDAVAVGSVMAGAIVYFANGTDLVANFTFEGAPLLHTYSISLPLVSVGLYLAYVHGSAFLAAKPTTPKPATATTAAAAPSWMDAVLLRALQGWNFLLTVLSICMLFGLTAPVAQFAFNNGWKEAVCDKDMQRWHGPLMFWLYVFVMSKYIELIDTVFLIVRNKPVSFLHWFHHASVLCYSWFATLAHYSPGFYFALVNCFVHTIMYWYYYRAALGYRLTYDKFVTSIQMSQMVLGIVVCGLWAFLHYSAPLECPCDKPMEMVALGVLMYGSYLFLFASFYFKRYSKTHSKKQ